MKYLITAIGGDIAQSIAKILKEFRKDALLIGSDMHANHAGKHFVDILVTLPTATEENYIAGLKQIILEYQIDYVIPVNEKEILTIFHAIIEGELDKYSENIIIPKARGYEKYFNKLEMIESLKSYNKDLRLPWTINSSKTPLEFPCFYKPQDGSGSRGVEVVSKSRYSRNIDFYNTSAGVFQELLHEENEYTCGLYRSSRSSDVTQVIVLRRSLKGGLTGLAEIVYDEDIQSYCKKIGTLIKLNGAINIQLKKDKNDPVLFEINPRFSSTVIFRNHVGFKDLIWSIEDKMLSSEKVDYDVIPHVGSKFFRVFKEYYE
jgi:carbamoyl-phosphate synthase large subunit